MTAQLLMGIDVGTYSTKGVLCTPGGEILALRQVEYSLSVPRPGWAEHDADVVWWGDVCAVSRALLTQAQVTGVDVAAISISALGPDLVPLDKAGHSLRPAILYGIDTRSTFEIADLNARFGAEAMADLAVRSPEAFAALVDRAKEGLAAKSG